MAYQKRVYTDTTEEVVTYEDMNRIEEGIYQADQNKVDKVDGKGLSTEDYTTEEKEKLASVDEGANNYTHPASHQASMIVQNAERRFVSDSEKAAWNAKETTEGAQAKATEALTSAKEYADGKVKLNGTTANVNFIENQVVQDGLVDLIKQTDDFTVMFKLKSIVNNVQPIGGLDGVNKSGWICQVQIHPSDANKKWIRLVYYSNVGTIEYFYDSNKNAITSLDDIITLTRKGNMFFIFVNNSYIYSKISIKDRENTVVNVHSSVDEKCKYIYNRPLTQAEINHNLSVLNNTQSINHINDYTISTDSSHIEMATNRTLEEEYTELLSTMGKEFTSTGEDITVNNAIKSKILSGKMSGNTVKCIYADSDWVTFNATGYSAKAIPLTLVPQLKPNTTYVVIAEVKENTRTETFRIASNPGSADAFLGNLILPTIGFTGFIKKVMTTKTDFTGVTLAFTSKGNSDVDSGVAVFKRAILEITDTSLVNDYIPFGLSSTQAIIDVNGLKHSFYSLNEQGEKELITLGAVGDVKDTLEMKSDGSLALTQSNYKEIPKTKTLSEFGQDDVNVWMLFRTDYRLYNLSANSMLCDKYNVSYENPVAGLNTQIVIGAGTQKNRIFYVVSKSICSTQSELINMFAQDDFVIFYKLESPIITHIPKEVNGVIPIPQQTIICSVDSAVTPSSLSITVPVDRVAEQQEEIDNLKQEIAEIKSLLASPSNLSLSANYAEDEYQECLDSINQI